MVFYVVPTPIGNIKDMTYRAVEVLKDSDIILCEDTRLTLRLLNYYGINKRLISYHKFNEFKLIDRIISEINLGVKYALVSDAGMPGISDPGCMLIKRCIDNNIKVDVLPGACALVNGIILSGFEFDRFTFLGFLPRNTKLLKEVLMFMKKSGGVFVIYESPHRILFTLEVFKEEFGGNNKIYLGRELTKMFEENFRGTVNESIKHFSENKIRGEFVICIEILKECEEINEEFILQEFYKNKRELNLTTKENIKKICKNNNLKKNFVYDLILKNK